MMCAGRQPILSLLGVALHRKSRVVCWSRDALLEVIQGLCAMLGTQHAGALPDRVASLQRSCAALPRLEQFVSDVCEVRTSQPVAQACHLLAPGAQHCEQQRQPFVHLCAIGVCTHCWSPFVLWAQVVFRQGATLVPEADAGKPAAVPRVLARWAGELQALQQMRQVIASLADALRPQRAPGALKVTSIGAFASGDVSCGLEGNHEGVQPGWPAKTILASQPSCCRWVT